MKKVFISFILLMAVVSAQAATMTTKVSKVLEPDDEGVKIRVQDPANESLAIAVYLRNTHQQYEQILNLLQAAQADGSSVVISTQQEGKLTVIDKVSLN